MEGFQHLTVRPVHDSNIAGDCQLTVTPAGTRMDHCLSTQGHACVSMLHFNKVPHNRQPPQLKWARLVSCYYASGVRNVHQAACVAFRCAVTRVWHWQFLFKGTCSILKSHCYCEKRFTKCCQSSWGLSSPPAATAACAGCTSPPPPTTAAAAPASPARGGCACSCSGKCCITTAAGRISSGGKSAWMNPGVLSGRLPVILGYTSSK